MRKTCLILALYLVFCPRGWSQTGIVGHQLDRIENLNNNHQAEIARQAGPGGATTGAPAAAPPMPSPGLLPPANPEQTKLVEQFATNLASFKPGVAATPVQLSNLVAGISSLSKSGVKPGKEMVSKLASSVGDVLKEKALSAKDLHSLSACISAVMNSANLPASTSASIVMRAQNLLKTDGISEPAVTAFSQSLTGISSYIQKNKPRLFQ